MYKYTESFEQPSDVLSYANYISQTHTYHQIIPLWRPLQPIITFASNQNSKKLMKMCTYIPLFKIAWIYILNLESKVPLYNNAVYVKVLKLKNTSHNKLFSENKLNKAITHLNKLTQSRINNTLSTDTIQTNTMRNKGISPQPTVQSTP
jgi:hypothetical protein